MKSQILNLSSKLISISSTKDNPKALKKVLEGALEELKDFTIEPFEKERVPSVLVYPQSKRPKKFKVILNAHLDVVAGKEEQFQPEIKNNRLYGRGAIDMKAASAVEILLFKELAGKLNYPLALQLVTDEEVGGFKGTEHQIEKGVKADFVIAGEPTNFGINHKAKGIVWAKVHFTGQSAHGAYPWQGENALWRAKKILDRLEKLYSLPKKEVWKTTVNLAKIETGNQTFNKVPDEAILWLDIRYIPEELKGKGFQRGKEILVKKLKKIFAAEGRLETILVEPPQLTNENNPYVLALKKSIKKITNKTPRMIVKHGGSDIRHFNQIGIDGVTFGPIGFGLHSDEEWVDIKSLEDYYLILKDFLLRSHLS